MADKMDTRLPYFEGQKDFMGMLRFLDNRKAYAGYMNGLDEKITKFMAAAKLYGKAKDIEKLHEDAELWVKRAEFDYGEREKKLVAGEKALAAEVTEKRAKLEERERAGEKHLRESSNSVKARETAVQAREDEVGNLEQVAAKAEMIAQAKALGAVEAKREAEAMVARMKVAVA